MATFHQRLLSFNGLLACILCLPLVSCDHVQKIAGFRTDLSGEKVVEVRIHSSSENRVCPGKSISLRAEIELESGEVLQTTGSGGGHVLWDSFSLNLSNLQDVQKGELLKLYSEPDIRSLLEKEISVSVTARGERKITSNTLVFLPRSDCQLEADFSGSKGEDGTYGDDAPRFRQRGKRGQRGLPGTDGNSVNAVITLADEDHLQACIGDKSTFPKRASQLNTTNSICYFLDVNEGSLLVTTRGGNGGNGGEGGRSSYSYGATWQSRPGGRKGEDGIAGRGANGGKGGDIEVVFSAAAATYRSQFRFEAVGGSGGESGDVGVAGGRNGEPGKVTITTEAVIWPLFPVPVRD